MKASLTLATLCLLPNWVHPAAVAQDPPPPGAAVTPAPGSREQGDGSQERGPRGPRDGRDRPVFGKISAIGTDTIEITSPDGNKITLKLTSSTEFRKDRQPAKLADFKVDDPVVVRTDQADGKGTTALLVATGQFARRNGQGEGPGGIMSGGVFGSLGKDFVIGEVKSVDPPRLTVLRPDNVSQTMELNEETSLRRGRESVTMADVHVGDHVMARGAVENSVFVPKNLNVMSPEQWKRIEEMLASGRAGVPPKTATTPNVPTAPNAPPTSPEPQN